jgi:hypothetical protein
MKRSGSSKKYLSGGAGSHMSRALPLLKTKQDIVIEDNLPMNPRKQSQNFLP